MRKYQYNPDTVSPPGDTISDILEERAKDVGWLAQKMGMSESQISDLLIGLVVIDDTIAEKLSSVLGSTARFWLARERNYREKMK